MRLSRIISSLCLALLIWGMQDISVYAQKKDSPESSFNAINLRFQKFDNTPVTVQVSRPTGKGPST